MSKKKSLIVEDQVIQEIRKSLGLPPKSLSSQKKKVIKERQMSLQVKVLSWLSLQLIMQLLLVLFANKN